MQSLVHIRNMHTLQSYKCTHLSPIHLDKLFACIDLYIVSILNIFNVSQAIFISPPPPTHTRTHTLLIPYTPHTPHTLTGALRS